MEKEKIRFAIGIAFVLVLAYYAFSTRESHWNSVSSWYDPVVTKDEVRAAQWVDGNVPHWRLFAADLFSCEMITAVAREHCTIGGAWELADKPNDRYWSNQLMFTANSSLDAWNEAEKWNVDYVLVADRNSFYAYGWKKPNAFVFEDAQYFKKIYEEGDSKVYEVVR